MENQPPTLDDILHRIWTRLSQALVDPDSPLRTPVLATAGGGGEPDARIVVLRQVDSGHHSLRVNTDRRSPKRHELAERSRGLFVFFDPREGIQLRARADIVVHQNDPVARHAWEALPPAGRRLYMTEQPPGSPAPGPTDGNPRPTSADAEARGYGHFSVLAATIRRFDWLRFTPTGPLRAGFSFREDGSVGSQWLYP